MYESLLWLAQRCTLAGACIGMLAAPLGVSEGEDPMARLISEDVLAVITIAQEALMEPYEGKLAVAEVIRNRMQQKYASDGTVEGTVLRPLQFSGWNTGDHVRIRSMRWDDQWERIQECKRAWQDALNGSNITRQAVLYYNPTVVLVIPKWARPEHAQQVAHIGQHVFYVPLTRALLET